MVRDPIVEEIRKIRRDIEQECKQDSEAYFAHLLDIQQKYADRLVCRRPKPALLLQGE